VPEHPPSSELSTTIRQEPGGVRLVLRGELDMNGVMELERAVQEAAGLAERRLTIDLARLDFIDLFGARTLLRAADQAFTGERRVQIANPNRHVRRLFELITDLTEGRTPVTDLVPPRD
jgi:anti-anti-sigma factor